VPQEPQMARHCQRQPLAEQQVQKRQGRQSELWLRQSFVFTFQLHQRIVIEVQVMLDAEQHFPPAFGKDRCVRVDVPVLGNDDAGFTGTAELAEINQNSLGMNRQVALIILPLPVVEGLPKGIPEVVETLVQVHAVMGALTDAAVA
jgi:hypothetical protein